MRIQFLMLAGLVCLSGIPCNASDIYVDPSGHVRSKYDRPIGNNSLEGKKDHGWRGDGGRGKSNRWGSGEAETKRRAKQEHDKRWKKFNDFSKQLEQDMYGDQLKNARESSRKYFEKEKRKRRELEKARYAARYRQEQLQLAHVRKARQAGNIARAIQILERMSASGSPNGAFILGTMFLNGDGVKRDKQKATDWFQKAAKNGSSKGAYILAQAYLEGDGREKNLKEAVRWLEASQSPEAQYTLGQMYLEGVGAQRNFSRAWSAFKKSKTTSAKAGLGEICYLGLGMRKSSREALKWLQQAAGENNPKALFYLARMYSAGDGVKKDEKQAETYLSRYQESKKKQLDKGETFENQLAVKDFDNMEERMRRLSKSSTSTRKASSKPKVIARKRRVEEKTDAVPQKSNTEVFMEVARLVSKFYPRAKVSRTDKKMHFEFKTRVTRDLKKTEVRVPRLDGIVGDIILVEGRYPGREILPSQTNGTHYVSLLMAPYSASDNKHLLTRLKFPPNAPVEFVVEFKKLLNLYSG